VTFEVDCRYDNRQCVVCRHKDALNEDHPAPDYDTSVDTSLPQQGILYTDNKWWPQFCAERRLRPFLK
jgi:hypothetical protein